MKEISVGARTYRLIAVGREGAWTAHAERAGNGDWFGIECSGESEAAAIDRLERWLTWQHQHSSALDELQQAERSYHRTIAGSAFGNPVEGPTPIELQKASLEQLEAARVRLDTIRARKPL